MPHQTALVATIAAGIALAFGLGMLAARLRIPPLVGYLLAGIAVGPFTPGFVADLGLAQQLAEIGVILLLFGVGIHFSVDDLLSVRRIALPGAAVQIATATVLGAAVSRLWGWSWGSGIVLGLCLSVASTVVLLRALEDRGLLDTADGRIAVGWLVVEDLATVLVLVLLPALAVSLGGKPPGAEGASAGGSPATTIVLTLGKVAAFVMLMVWWAVARCPGCWSGSPEPGRGSCSRSRSSRWPSARPWARPRSSASRSRWGRSSPDGGQRLGPEP